MEEKTKGVKREEFWYDSRDGVTKLRAMRWIPEKQPRAIVQIVHGMAEHVMRYDEFATFLAQQGILVVGNDHLGHGLSRRQDVQAGYFCERDAATVLVRDVHRLKKLVQDGYPGIPYVILGHSLGSFLLRNYMNRYGTGIQGALLLGTGQPKQAIVQGARFLTWFMGMFLGAKRAAGLLNDLLFQNYNAHFGKNQQGAVWLNSQPEEVAVYEQDPLCGFALTWNGYHTLLELIAYSGNADALKRVPKNLPVRILSGSEDVIGDFGAGALKVYETFQKHGMIDVSYKLYEGARHEILREKQKTEVYEDILEFIRHITEEV